MVDYVAKIHVLDEETQKKIAAGEVIERPANVVKELIENALDANATNIKIAIEAGGLSSIKVTDNGEGMTPEDVKICWKEHTTSKISTIQDLNHLSTLGFRGEALYSIAVVSRLTIASRTKSQDMGYQIRIQEARIIDERPIAMKPGTIILVEDLFYNLPVRRKFLHSITREFDLILEVVRNYALAYLDVEFSLTHNKKKILHVPKRKNYKETVTYIYGYNVAKNLTEVKKDANTFTLTALLENPQLKLRKKSVTKVFVNKRPIESKLIENTIKRGYQPYLVKGDRPTSFLFITMDPKYFDINIHPTKKEIRFYDPNTVEETIITLIEETFQHTLLKTQLQQKTFPELGGKIDVMEKQAASTTKKESIPVQNQITATEHVYSPDLTDQNTYFKIEKTQTTFTTQATQQQIDTFTLNNTPYHVRIIGQYAKTYLLLEELNSNSLIIIDQHALSERIMLERIEKKINKSTQTRQKLLQPITLAITETELKLFSENQVLIEKLGFEFSMDEASNQLTILSIPYPEILKEWTYESISALIKELVTKKSTFADLNRELLNTIACHSAIRAGKELSITEIRNLIHEIPALIHPTICAHGRPTLLIIPKNEFDKKFRRIV